MRLSFYKSGEINGRYYVKIPLRSSAFSNFENDDKNCFLWSVIAYLHLCNRNHPNRILNYRKLFNEVNVEGFDFTNGLECSDVYKFEKLKSLSVNINELTF